MDARAVFGLTRLTITHVVLKPIVHTIFDILLALGILNSLGQWRWGEVEVDQFARIGILRAHFSTDPMSPVASLNHIWRRQVVSVMASVAYVAALSVPLTLLVSKLFHQGVKDPCIVLQCPASFRRPVRKAVARHGRNNDMKGREIWI